MIDFDFNRTPAEQATLEREADTVGNNTPNGEVIEFPAENVPMTLATLMAKKFPPLKWIVQDILPEGLTLLAGPSKLGKSWLSLDIALGVSFGGTVMSGIEVEQGDVLFWALEDSQRRIQDRTLKVLPHGADWDDSKLRIETTANLPPPLDEGGMDMIEQWHEAAQNPRLIIIDVYAKVSPQKKGGESEYDAIY